MREILFRGKRFDNGEWIEGYLFQIWDDALILWGTTNGVPDMIKVIPETVGQYTGLKGKDGRKIFEGDVLQVVGYGEVVDRCIIGYGTYKPYCYGNKMVGFYLYWKNDKCQHDKYANLPYWLETREAVCVGNIHDNPELIERSEIK